jgi:SET family sugar efflux transporter-like MFS transporter
MVATAAGRPPPRAVTCWFMGVQAATGGRRLTARLFPLGLVFLASGLSVAVVQPFLSLFLSDEVHAGPVRVTVFLVVAPLSGVLTAWAIGRLSDRRAIRRRLLIAASIAGVIGSAITAVVRDYWVLLGLTATAVALATSLFPQSFAYARQVLTRDDPDRASMGISVLRTVFSIAWVAGPPLAALLLSTGGWVWVYGAATLMYAVAALVAVRWLTELGPVPATPDEGAPPPNRMLWLTAAGFTLLQCPLVLAVQALPLFISVELGGSPGQAGLILGLCAALEIPLMLAFGWLSTRIPLSRLILAGAVTGVLYYGLAAFATSVWQLAVGQLLNALFIAAVSGLGISYMQDMLPQFPGRATTMFTNTFPIGAVLAGPLFGISQQFGYRLAYVISATLCVLGLLVLVITRNDQPPRRA